MLLKASHCPEVFDYNLWLFAQLLLTALELRINEWYCQCGSLSLQIGSSANCQTPFLEGSGVNEQYADFAILLFIISL